MKLFNKKEEKRSVGRPRIADTITKKKAIISICVCLVLVLALLLSGAFKLNIINFNKLKGTVNVNLCSEIPLRFQPRSESNPEGTYEYGFTDPKFYSAVVSTYNEDATYCSTITEEQLRSVNDLVLNNSYNFNGLQYLKGLKKFSYMGGALTSLDFSGNPLLEEFSMVYGSIGKIDVSNNPELKRLTIALYVKNPNGNALTTIDLSHNLKLNYLNLMNNNLSNVDLSKNTALTSLNLSYNNLTNIDLSQNTALTYLNLDNNKFNTYSTIGNSIKLRQDVITAYPNDVTYSIDNPSIATYNNGVINKVSLGSTTLRATYKISDSYSYTVNYNITFNELKLTSNYYSIDNNVKTIDGKGEIPANIDVKKINLSLPNYEAIINNDELQIKDVDGNVVDVYKILNVKRYDEQAYLKAGFKDKNLYTSVVREYFNNEDLEGNYLLTEEELESINTLYCINRGVSDTNGIEKLTNLEALYLSYNNIESIDLHNNPNLTLLMLENNKLINLDVSKNSNLYNIQIQNNNISKIIGLEKLENLNVLVAYNNNLSSIDTSKTSNLELLMVGNNPLSNTLHMLKGKEIEYKKDFKLNEAYELKYDITNTHVVTYKDNKLKALKEGISNIYLSSENIFNGTNNYYDTASKCYFHSDQRACEELENISEEESLLPYIINQEVKVYDITSKEYKVDKDKKTIDALNKDFDASKINLTLNGLTGILEDDKFIIKDGETIVDTYKILNMKKAVDNSNNSGNNKNYVTTTKKSGSNTKITTKKKTTTTEKLEDITIEGENVPLATLLLVKGKDRNIVVKNEGITITINGKDIEKIEGNLDLNYEINILKESLIYEVVKDKVTSGIVLSFKSNSNLPGKVLVDVEVTDKIKKNIGTKDLYLYNYDKDKMMLVADKINLNNNKLSFYINKLGNYVLTNKELNKKNIDIDSSMYKENNELSKDISNKKLIIPIVIFILLIILGIIGYSIYKKNKDKND